MLKNSVCIAATYIGTFVGAGFASGQEIMQYFALYGKYGFLGAAFCGVLFFCFCYCSMYCCKAMGSERFLEAVNFTPFLKYLFCAFMVLMFCTMVTASGEMFVAAFGVSKMWGVFAMIAVSATLLSFGAKGVVRLNAVATPVAVLGIVVISLVNVYKNTVAVMADAEYLKSSVIYISYNTITLSSITAGMNHLIKNKRTIFVSSVLSGGILAALILCELGALMFLPSSASEIPMLDLLSEGARAVYLPVLFLSMLTTAVANGFGAAEVFKNKRAFIVVLSLVAVLFSVLKFSFIVKNLYSLFGYIGIAVLINNFIIFLKVRKTEKNGEKCSIKQANKRKLK